MGGKKKKAKTYLELVNKKAPFSQKSTIYEGNMSKKKSKLNPKNPIILIVPKNVY